MSCKANFSLWRNQDCPTTGRYEDMEMHLTCWKMNRQRGRSGNRESRKLVETCVNGPPNTIRWNTAWWGRMERDVPILVCRVRISMKHNCHNAVSGFNYFNKLISPRKQAHHAIYEPQRDKTTFVLWSGLLN